MKKTVYADEFVAAFDTMGRGDNFSRAGRYALYDYLVDAETDMGSDGEYELDVIELCCTFSEYPSAYDAMEQYQPGDMPVEGEDGDDLLEIAAKNEQAALEWLRDRTQVITFDGGVIIQQF